MPRTLALKLFAPALLGLAACTQHGGAETAATPPRAQPANDMSELRWARGALERNPDLKVESVDESKGTIKVRVKSSGEIATVSPGELAAIPIGDLVTLSNAARVAQSEGAAAARRVTEEPVAPEPQPPAPEPRKNTEYKVERDGDRVRISGPGVNIESTGEGGVSAHGAEKQYDDPIICEGRRTLFLDGRRMNVSGEAIIARDGCELHLSNSEIAATGTGIVVRDATVHIANSTVQGGEASIDLGANTRAFLQHSNFIGISRRDSLARITDQGGNTWR